MQHLSTICHMSLNLILMFALTGCASTKSTPNPREFVNTIERWEVAQAPKSRTRSGGLPGYYIEAAPATVEMPFSVGSNARRAAGILVHSDGWIVASTKSLEGIEPTADLHLEIQLRIGHLDESGVMRRGPVRVAKVHKLEPTLGLALLKLVGDSDHLPEPIQLSASGPTIGQDVKCITHGDQLWETYGGQVVSVSESISSQSLTVLVDCGESLQATPRLGTILVSEAGEVLAMHGRSPDSDQGTTVQMAHVDELRAFLQETPDEPVMLMPDALGPGVR
jgi:hypothetical protein